MTALKLNALCSVSAAALMLASATPADAQGRYRSGDFHNHTVCSDGSTSVRTLTDASLTYLDWFIMAGHSGDGSRDCRFDDETQSGLGNGRILWQDTIGADGILGNQVAGDGTVQPKSGAQNPPEMWRWQAIEQYTYPDTLAGGLAANEPAFVGLEWVVPGHEHASTSVITGQYPAASGALGDALGMAQFEYCFARNSNDNSGGFDGTWSCEISAANNAALITRFQNDPDQGPADYNSTLVDGVNTDDTGDHVKSTAAIYWMQENHAGKAYAAPAHVERQGAFIPDDNEGFNIEHLRDWHNAGPDVAFGFESQPGHQGQFSRGSYNAGRPSVGGFTYGGTGCYAAAEAAQPGKDFDGNDLTSQDLVDRFPAFAGEEPAKVTLCREGVRTAWDAMLSEGRHYWFFGSSDWHNRGSFPFFDHRTTNDFLPGEYQKNYAYIRTRNPDDPAQDIVDGLRSGNGFVTQGDLIDGLSFRACWQNTCATMGQTLSVPPATDVSIRVRFRDPSGTNHSKYAFANPALLPLGINEPLNEPSVRQVDFITGNVTGLIPATDPDYRTQLAPDTTVLAASFTADGQDRWRGRGPWKRITWMLEDVTTDKYIRMRGSNLPAGTPHARDADGNPLRDDNRDNIACDVPDCPDHVNGVFTADVEAWGDVWFYTNPIFIEIDSNLTTASVRRGR